MHIIVVVGFCMVLPSCHGDFHKLPALLIKHIQKGVCECEYEPVCDRKVGRFSPCLPLLLYPLTLAVSLEMERAEGTGQSL